MSHMLDTRRAGVLLHPTSLPGPGYCGNFGAHARRFIDLIAGAGHRLWQVLPLGPTHRDGCPYQSFSVHAGNPDLIDLQWLVDRGWLEPSQAKAGQASPAAKREALGQATRAFFRQVETAEDNSAVTAYGDFLRMSSYWLENYVRFQAFRSAFNEQPWTEWPEGIRECEPRACDRMAREVADELSELRFHQFVFSSQWHELRQYANEKDVMLFGDMPIYVHMESADVWAYQDLFDLDENRQPVTVTGVPPDYFSAEGQLWGNPQYDWQRMRETGFDWWLQRFHSAAREFDIARIDHFRALQAYWEIPAHATSAKEGHWVQAPGRELLQQVQEQCPQLCLVAENLGTIGPEVEALRAEFSLPGMVILQFAFDGNPENPYLSHRHQHGDIVYTGTHDNNTTLGWFDSLTDELRGGVYRYFNHPRESMPWMLICQAMASPCVTAMVPWQDFLGLGERDRMNTPGTTEGNWQWRFSWDQVSDDLEQRMRDLLAYYDRVPSDSGMPLNHPTSD
jgi:4-alpha-glucanotransferase